MFAIEFFWKYNGLMIYRNPNGRDVMDRDEIFPGEGR